MAAEGVAINSTLVEARAALLGLHSPTHFLRELPLELQQLRYGTGAALSFGTKAGEEVWQAPGASQWLLQKLAWDTEYFGTSTYRLFTSLFDGREEPGALATAAADLRKYLSTRGDYYAFSVVPAEDIKMLQALTGGGWRLIETRLNFFCPVAKATLPQPALVRLARSDEAAAIGRISATARNVYDRFHADPWFGEARADAFLARYAEAAVADGYADAVLIPDEPGLPLDSFLAIGDTLPEPDVPGSGSSRVLLTAVGPQNRGWHVKLVAETIRRASALSLPYVLMTTQATNKAVFRTCEKLGFQLGSASHVFACHNH